MIFFIFCAFIQTAYGHSHITIYGDVYQNGNFFTNTLPWLVDNIGGDLTIQFYMLGSGRHTIPQMCALSQLAQNSFLQAQFLKCEAEGNPSAYCLCDVGIEADKFKECVRFGGTLASQANEQYARLKLDALPLVEVGVKDTVFEVADEWYLKKICTLFLDDPPLGCVKPCKCNSTETWNKDPGVAQIDRDCKGILSDRDCQNPVTTSHATTPTTINTQTWFIDQV